MVSSERFDATVWWCDRADALPAVPADLRVRKVGVEAAADATSPADVVVCPHDPPAADARSTADAVAGAVVAVVPPDGDPSPLFPESPGSVTARDQRIAAVVRDGPGVETQLANRVRAVLDHSVRRADSELLRSLLSDLPDQIFFKDESSRFVRVSASAASAYGLDPADMVGLSDFDLIEREDVARGLYEDEQRIMRTGEPIVNKVEHYVGEDDQVHWVSTTKAPRHDESGAVVGTLGTTREITERMRQEQLIRALHTVTPDLMAATSPTEIARVIDDASRDVEDFPDFRLALADDGGDLELVDSARSLPAHFTGATDPFERAFQTGERQFVRADGSAASTRADETIVGTDQATDVVAVTIPLGEHGALGVSLESGSFTAFSLDLAQVLAANVEGALARAQREALLRRREADLARQNEHLEEFASIVSHDLRNPLSVAKGYTEVAMETGDTDRLVDVADALDEMESMTTELLTLARKGTVVDETESVRLDAVAREAWATAETGAARLVVPETGTVDADRDRLAELLGNLFRNAVEHGGAETVTVAETSDGFRVDDDGCGIPADEREAVLEQGYTNSEDGTGLGLYIVRSIAEAHGWSVAVGETESGGMRLWVGI
ncbi:PAS domain-containing sensor histidine kinase [Haloarchaeobius sp. DYHT-AS-18]|uniref:PAS domain-containing sensor histidine kinase n=1 Tax=Haloarchaeobius sp. DYHT-AS-18 TaxID=3446117 RepID=UPI003EBF9AEC